MDRLPFLLCFLLLANEAFQGSICTLLAESSIAKCVRTSENDMECKQKLVLTLTVAAGKLSQEDEIKVILNAIKNGSDVKTLRDPQTITVSKSAVLNEYPVTFIQAFNRQPFEESRFVDKCNQRDCWLPTTRKNEKTVFWGLCCKCSLNSHHRQIKDDCGWTRLITNRASRHCLRMHNDWFNTFAVDLGIVAFKISVLVMSEVSKDVELVLNQNKLAAANSEGSVIAKLEGDLADYKQAPRFEGVYFSQPPIWTKPVDEDVQFLLIDRHKYSESGATCDLIGTSYKAFISVNVPCTRPQGFCLAYQLQDYIRDEENRRLRGLKAIYAARRYRGFFVVIDAQRDPDEHFYIPVDGNRKSVLVLEINADKLQFIVNRSPGRIISMNCTNFEALNGDGYCDATVVNVGELPAGYTLGLSCDSGIITSPAVALSLKPNEPVVKRFDVNSNGSANKTFLCVANLQDAEGQETDKIDKYVSITATKFSNTSRMESEGASVQLKPLNNGGGGLFGGLGDALGGAFGFTKNLFKGVLGIPLSIINTVFGSSVGGFIGSFFKGIWSMISWIFGGGSLFKSGSCNCKSSFDILCILKNFCFRNMVYAFGSILLVVGVVMAFVLLHRIGALRPMGRCFGRFAHWLYCLPFRFCKRRNHEDDETSDHETDDGYSLSKKNHISITKQSFEEIQHPFPLEMSRPEQLRGDFSHMQDNLAFQMMPPQLYDQTQGYTLQAQVYDQTQGYTLQPQLYNQTQGYTLQPVQMAPVQMQMIHTPASMTPSNIAPP